MFMMFGDEADSEQGRNQKFFVYGAIIVPTDRVADLHAAIEGVRRAADFAPTDSLKSASRSRPKSMTPATHRNAKKSVMAVARDVGRVRFCAYVILHELARKRSHDELVLWGANTILGKFNEFLGEQNSVGYATLDKIPVEHPERYLREKFQVGLTFPGKSPRRLERVLGFSQAVDGTSHMASVADIMLGAFRYCVNQPENPEAGKAMFPTLMSMMWKRQHRGKFYVGNCGLVLRPVKVDEPRHQAEYDRLIERLESYLPEEE